MKCAYMAFYETVVIEPLGWGFLRDCYRLLFNK